MICVNANRFTAGKYTKTGRERFSRQRRDHQEKVA